MEFNSFKELARFFGKQKAEQKLSDPPATHCAEQCGRLACILWLLIQDHESCKRYGKKGEIVCTPEYLVDLTGYDNAAVTGALLRLITKGWLRPTVDGRAVKAA